MTGILTIVFKGGNITFQGLKLTVSGEETVLQVFSASYIAMTSLYL